MDCGPAALKCLLDGHGIPVSYGRLREACQTDVDGTSIDTLEEIAVQLGLDAEQIMLPPDHVLLPEARALPAIAVVALPNGVTHFIVVWSQRAGLVQLMDPGSGRRWVTRSSFLAELYQHVMPVPAGSWREWAESDEAQAAIRRRISNLGLSKSATRDILEAALASPGWYRLGCLDAATRAVESMARSRGARRGREAEAVLKSLLEQAGSKADDTINGDAIIPKPYWSVRAADSKEDEEEQVLLRGAVLVRVRGRRTLTTPMSEDQETDPPSLRPEVEAALKEPTAKPGRELARWLLADGLLAPMSLITALFGATLGLIIEALLFRGLLELAPQLQISGQRLGAMGMLVGLMVLLLLLELPIAGGQLRLGRKLEARVRILFQQKIPRLGDRYFHSRLTSDMAERNHAIHTLRTLPVLGGNLIRVFFEVLLTAAAIIWLHPASAPIALICTAAALALPLAFQPLVSERDLRVRSHLGSLGQFYLDALLGLVAVKTHGAGDNIRSQHEGLLVEWGRSQYSLRRAVLWLEGAQALIGYALAAWLVLTYLTRGGEVSVILLLAYWALNLPVAGLELAQLVWTYPAHRNVTLRLLEPLTAREETETGVTPPARADQEPPAAIAMQKVSARAGGHVILDQIDLEIEAGDHVAVVGPSGAGKTSLFGLLIGWHRPAAGNLLVDGEVLRGENLLRLRTQTAWLDPAIQIWNRSFLDNLRYGTDSHPSLPLATVVEQADLKKVLETLPDGYQTSLGEGGGLVSGGEGQRVRLGRAMLRPGVRLVLLDEPFRGLDRTQRSELLARARRFWKQATLLCITHDLAETRAFDRVLVVEGGRIVEDGSPGALAADPDSRYRSMLDSEEALRQVWSESTWRRWQIIDGQISESHGSPQSKCE
jgi:ATP-binding cassette subfamily B protein